MGSQMYSNAYNDASGPAQDILGYNYDVRCAAVYAKANEKFAEIRTKTLAAISGNSSPEVSTFSAGTDGVEGQLGTLRSTLAALQSNVESYVGPHFQKMYRKILSDGLHLQGELDKLELSDRDDLRQERKALLCSVETSLKDIEAKVHPDGVCPDCTVSVV